MKTFSHVLNATITGGDITADGADQRFTGCDFHRVRIVASGDNVFVRCRFFACEVNQLAGAALDGCLMIPAEATESGAARHGVDR